jgi:hypothetical protein
MKQDKKQLHQLIALGVLALAFIGFVCFQFTGNKDSAASTPGKTSTAQGSEATPSDTDGTAVKTEQVSDLIARGVFPALSKALPSRDPFILQTMPDAPAVDQVVAPARTNTAPTNYAPRPDFGNERVPPITVRPINPFGSTASADSGARTPAIEPERQFTVTGVVRGDRNVAIMYDSTGGRHLVREGQPIGGQYRLLSVGRDGVLLSHHDKVIYVKLGGAKDAG